MVLNLVAFQVDYIIPLLSPFRIGFGERESYTLQRAPGNKTDHVEPTVGTTGWMDGWIDLAGAFCVSESAVDIDAMSPKVHTPVQWHSQRPLESTLDPLEFVISRKIPGERRRGGKQAPPCLHHHIRSIWLSSFLF
jgi:hypothetical protein